MTILNCLILRNFKIKIMKKIVLLLFISFSITSCTKSVEKNLEEKITEFIKPKYKDPESFEFISLTYKTELVKSRKTKITDEKIESLKDNEYAIDLVERMKKEKSFLDKQTNENAIAVYDVKFIAKGTNSFGAKIQTEYSASVLADENFTVLSVK